MFRGRSDRRAFTLIEMLVVILIIGILAAYFGQNIFAQTNDARIASAEALLKEKVPEALASFYLTHSGEARPSKAQLMQRGVNESPIWKTGAWYISGSGSTVAIAYPTGTPSDIEQSYRNAIAIAKSMAASDYKGPITKGSKIRDISPDYPMVDHVYIKDLNRDGMDGVGGIGVYYKANVAH